MKRTSIIFVLSPVLAALLSALAPPLAAAHSRALARLSRDIAEAVRALDRSGR